MKKKDKTKKGEREKEKFLQHIQYFCCGNFHPILNYKKLEIFCHILNEILLL
jgi:hypothetical protein